MEMPCTLLQIKIMEIETQNFVPCLQPDMSLRSNEASKEAITYSAESGPGTISDKKHSKRQNIGKT